MSEKTYGIDVFEPSPPVMMRVVVKDPGKAPEVMTIGTGLDAMKPSSADTWK